MAKEPKTKVEKVEFKYGIADIAEATGMAPPSIRVGLRDGDFEKEGSRWGWNRKADVDAIIKHFKERQLAPKPAKAEKPAKEKKPRAKRKAKEEA